jgi:hypothetical protein
VISVIKAGVTLLLILPVVHRQDFFMAACLMNMVVLLVKYNLKATEGD